MPDSTLRTRPSFPVAAWRAVTGWCPNCGRGRLFVSYLKQVERCAVCGEAYGHLRADDAPPWLTILIVGHIVVPLAVGVDRLVSWPTWAAITLWCAIALVLCLLVLPRAKAVFLTGIWITRGPGSEGR
jgi:uncharacterized protein (DUF983 family)